MGMRWMQLMGGAALVALAGCSSIGLPGGGSTAPAAPPPIGASTAPKGGTCNAQAAQWAVGQSATAKVVEQARVRAGARMARTLRPDQPATLEFNAERLNLQLDAGGKVTAARCG
ncbi:Peptidase inhibitor I78 family protein [Oryzisolibacter propanilivorax]|uniref:Peptidase inhibitor I78 family protein n=2 Tax=Oryzisolibacter propanilivorax TaxID=1527607 RepID=A0A1G9RAN3_9BURK|nr:Peptidase inhibitor I78 family protein [Oryzisolibacter propanilivorax]